MQPAGPLDDLAAFLVTPAKSGIYLTKNEIIVLARLSDGSLRVSDRRRMLVDVLKSAPSTEELAMMVDRLRAFCEVSIASYRELASASPAAATALAPWIERADKTITRLQNVAAEIRL